MDERTDSVDVVMVGTFSAWRLGTLQSRALPLASELSTNGIRCAIVTVPWDAPPERGVTDIVNRVALLNTRTSGIATAPFAITQQVNLIRHLRPQLIHVFKPKGFGGFAGQLQRSIPVVIDSDDWEGDGGWNRIGGYNVLQRRIFQWQERALLRRAVGVTAASVLLYHRARSLRSDGNAHHVWYLPNGLASDWVELLAGARRRRQEKLDVDRRIVLYSRFAEFGADWLPRFAAALVRGGIGSGNVVLDVVGQVERSIPTHGELSVEYRGYVDRTTIPDVLGSGTLAVFPYEDSLVTRSKNSVKLLELMAAGCPVIASDVGDIRPTLGSAGVIVDGADPELFAQAAVRLLDWHDLLWNMGTTGTERVRGLYTTAAIGRSLADVYRVLGVVGR